MKEEDQLLEVGLVLFLEYRARSRNSASISKPNPITCTRVLLSIPRPCQHPLHVRKHPQPRRLFQSLTLTSSPLRPPFPLSSHISLPPQQFSFSLALSLFPSPSLSPKSPKPPFHHHRHRHTQKHPQPPTYPSPHTPNHHDHGRIHHNTEQ